MYTSHSIRAWSITYVFLLVDIQDLLTTQWRMMYVLHVLYLSIIDKDYNLVNNLLTWIVISSGFHAYCLNASRALCLECPWLIIKLFRGTFQQFPPFSLHEYSKKGVASLSRESKVLSSSFVIFFSLRSYSNAPMEVSKLMGFKEQKLWGSYSLVYLRQEIW